MSVRSTKLTQDSTVISAPVIVSADTLFNRRRFPSFYRLHQQTIQDLYHQLIPAQQQQHIALDDWAIFLFTQTSHNGLTRSILQ